MAGYAIAIVLAGLLAMLAITTRVGNDPSTLTSMLNPSPSIALLPLDWFGSRERQRSLCAHSLDAVDGGPVTQSASWRCPKRCGWLGAAMRLTGPRYMVKIRTLIAMELVFGVVSGSGGLAWLIYENKNELQIANAFAGPVSINLIGFFAENIIFRNIELKKIRKWGVQQ
ncbi:MAG: hypothetical protein JSR91_06835 [Proteobacteria bacterium]|nr:hypothetical protein [Pseudomonadota bacterium]